MNRPYWVVRVRADGRCEHAGSYTTKGNAKHVALFEVENAARWPGEYVEVRVTREGETLLSYPVGVSV